MTWCSRKFRAAELRSSSCNFAEATWVASLAVMARLFTQFAHYLPVRPRAMASAPHSKSWNRSYVAALCERRFLPLRRSQTAAARLNVGRWTFDVGRSMFLVVNEDRHRHAFS